MINNICPRQKYFCSLLGLMPVDHAQESHQSPPAVCQDSPGPSVLLQPDNNIDSTDSFFGHSHVWQESKVKKYHCRFPGCDKEFVRSCSRSIHETSVHLNIKEYQCEVCRKEFSRKDDFLRHAYTHSGVKPYLCLACDRSFSQCSNVHTHIRRRHKVKPEKQVNWVRLQPTQV